MKEHHTTDEIFTEYWHTGNIRKIKTNNGPNTETFNIYYDTPKADQKLWGEGAYEKGKKAGCWKIYYFNGQLETFWKYENGVIQDGVYPFYNEAGVKIGENEYKNHKLFNGTVLLYWPDGTVREFYNVLKHKKVYPK